MKASLAAISLMTLLMTSGAAASLEHPGDVHPPPTLLWVGTQLIPSPEIGFGGPAYPRGFMRRGEGVGALEPFETLGATDEDPVRASKHLER